MRQLVWSLDLILHPQLSLEQPPPHTRTVLGPMLYQGHKSPMNPLETGPHPAFTLHNALLHTTLQPWAARPGDGLALNRDSGTLKDRAAKSQYAQ